MVRSAQDKSSPAAAEALEKLCRSYWYPLYAFARRSGRSPADAEDLTQGFFARLLEKDYLQSAAQELGRFRTFLLVSLKRFMANEWDRQHAQRRGGFVPQISIDQVMAESWLAGEPADEDQPDRLFDRHWAVTLLDRAMSQLRQEYIESGRAKLLEQLQGTLTQAETVLPYKEIAARLNLTEAAVKMAAMRLRARYRDLLRNEIAQTVSSPEEVDQEIKHLFSAFGD